MPWVPSYVTTPLFYNIVGLLSLLILRVCSQVVQKGRITYLNILLSKTFSSECPVHISSRSALLEDWCASILWNEFAVFLSQLFCVFLVLAAFFFRLLFVALYVFSSASFLRLQHFSHTAFFCCICFMCQSGVYSVWPRFPPAGHRVPAANAKATTAATVTLTLKDTQTPPALYFS